MSGRLALILTMALQMAAGQSHAEKAAPRFTDVTDKAGIDFVHITGASGKHYLPETMGAGGAVLDFDGDGWMDLFLVQSGPLAGFQGKASGHRLYRNQGNGQFADVTAGSGLGKLSGYGQGAVAADYDGDGKVDLYLTQMGVNRLFRNLGDGQFKDVTDQAGVGDPSWSSSAVFFDGDGDGDLDLYVVNYLHFSIETHKDCSQPSTGIRFYCHPDVDPAASDRYYRNLGDGRFQDATAAAGFTATGGKGLGAIAFDFDNDGDQDLYVANDSMPNFLYRNQGDGVFEEEGLLLGVAYNEDGRSEAGMGVDSADINGDGWPDLIVTNLSMEANALYLGGKQGFVYATRTAGLFAPSFPVLGFGVGFADFDNDGDSDLFVVNGDVQDNIADINDGLSYAQPSQLFLNNGRGMFTLESAAATGPPSEPRVGRGLLLLDFDNDGWLDLLITYSNGRARLFHNRGGQSDWLGLDLSWCGAPAIGSRVEITGKRGTQLRELRSGNGYQTSMDPRLHFGLGLDHGPWKLAIRWPDGHKTSVAEAQASGYSRQLRCPAKHGDSGDY